MNRRSRRDGAHSRLSPLWVIGLPALSFAGLFLLEFARPLRGQVEPKMRRTIRNFAVAGLSGLVVTAGERPIVEPLARWVYRRKIGLLRWFQLPLRLETFLGVLLLDYTLYWWHFLTHRVPFLWRFHKVHHADLDLDASTGVRFHFGELLISVLWRATQIVGLGVSPLALALWQRLLLISVIFHHSNVRLPRTVESLLSWVLVTPRMHGIHHSMLADETDSNWSSGLSVWDRLHHSFRLDRPQREIRIGVPDYPNPRDVTLPKILKMPLARDQPRTGG